jgi:hypothetical protein
MKPLAAILAMGLSGLGTLAAAGCPENSPKHGWATKSDDTRIAGDYLQSLLAGRKFRFTSGNTESYRKDGAYSFSEKGGKTWNAGGFRFYPDGVRCIGYSPPRFDLFVQRGNELWMITRDGYRSAGKILK